MEREMGKRVCLHFLVVIIQIFDSVLSCPASMPTISYVSHCPTNQEEWEKAAERKNCDSIAAIQNCTDRSKFQYHCLMNHWKNTTLEVCAPIFYLQGYCAEFNIQMKQVGEIYDKGFECLKFNDKHRCPRRYPSNEAYKYQRCYRYKNISMCTEKLSSKDKDNSWIALVFIVIVSLLFGILAFVVVMMRKGKCDKRSKEPCSFPPGCQQPNKNSEQNKLGETEETQTLLREHPSEMPKENISEADSFSPGCQQPNKNSEQNKLERQTRIQEQGTEMPKENISEPCSLPPGCQQPNKNSEQNKLGETEETQTLLREHPSEMPKENISEAPGCQQPNKNSEQNKLAAKPPRPSAPPKLVSSANTETKLATRKQNTNKDGIKAPPRRN